MAVLLVTSATAAGTAGAATGVSSPRLVGAARPGATLRVLVPNSWRRSGVGVTYTWLACDSLDCALITYGSQSTLMIPEQFDPSRVWKIVVVVTPSTGNGSGSTALSSGPLTLSS
jgi:hypothetical protein